jgi:hypothetical protein
MCECGEVDVRFGSKPDLSGMFAEAALSPKADIDGQLFDVRFVPQADIAVLPAFCS